MLRTVLFQLLVLSAGLFCVEEAAAVEISRENKKRKNLQMAISDAEGQQSMRFDLSGLSRGMYFVNMEQDGKKFWMLTGTWKKVKCPG